MPTMNRNKYNARKVWICENDHPIPVGRSSCSACGSRSLIKFDSQKEYNRWLELKLLERAGRIRGLKRQVKYELYAAFGDGRNISMETIKIRSKGYPNGRKATWTADFVYTENDEHVIEDCKGMDTPVSRLKRAIVEAMLGIEIRIT